MKYWIAVSVAAVTVLGAGRAYAQETTPGPGQLEATVIPGGVGFVMSKDGSPSFGNYGLGTGVTYNINRIIGIEGEVAAMIATRPITSYTPTRDPGVNCTRASGTHRQAA